MTRKRRRSSEDVVETVRCPFCGTRVRVVFISTDCRRCGARYSMLIGGEAWEPGPGTRALELSCKGE